MSIYDAEKALNEFEQKIRSLSFSDTSNGRETKSRDIVFDTETNFDDEEDASGAAALEAAANQFFEQFSVVKTDFKNPCQGQLPFSEFKKDLKEVTSGVYKKVLKEGKDDVIDVEQSIVTYEFAMFLEGSGTPFDSSFINHRPEVLKSGVGVLPGILCALSTMKKGEAADFWIHSDLMFGLKGCAPRVPPSADIVLHVKIIAVKQLAPVSEEGEQTEQKTPFMKMLKTAMKDYEKARNNFKYGNYGKCVATYRFWIEKVAMARMANENDEQKQRQFLSKLYQNAAVCYIKLNRPEKTCLMIRDLEKLQPIRDNVKALHAKGKANMMLLHYETARVCFIMASVASPNSPSVLAAIEELDKREAEKNKFEQDSAQLKQKAELQIQQREQKRSELFQRRSQEHRSLEVDIFNFEGKFKKHIEDFKRQTSNSFSSLTPDLQIRTPKHLKVAEKLCHKYKIHLKGYEDDIGSRVHYYLSK